MKHMSFKMSDDFYNAVSAYQKQHGIHSWSEALVELASDGYMFNTGDRRPERLPSPGGDRRSEAYRQGKK